jgi:molybdopterin-binding protein
MMKISARNMIKGKITALEVGPINAQAVVDIGGGNSITSVITADSVKHLGLDVGSDVYTVIKASEVMLAVD